MKFLRYYSIYCYYYYCYHYYYHRVRRSEQIKLSAGSRGAGHDNQNNREHELRPRRVRYPAFLRASLISNTLRRIISVHGKFNGRASSWLSRPGQSSLFPPLTLFSLLLCLFLSVCLPLSCLYFTLYSFAFLETFLVPASVRAPTTLSEFSSAMCDPRVTVR